MHHFYTFSALNFEAIFRHAPVGMIVGQDRVMVDCNDRALEIFHARRDDIVARSFAVLYPEQKDFNATGHRLVPMLQKREYFSDDRIMRRLDGSLFWCSVSGYSFNPHRPFELAVWTFVDLAEEGKAVDGGKSTLTARERDIAALLVQGRTSKEIGRELSISPRTVDVHRASLLKKFAVNSTSELVKALIK